MNNNRNIAEFSEEDDNSNKRRKTMPDLKLLQGGKGGGGSDTDWLTPLPVDTIFLCKSKLQTQNFAVMRLRVDYRYESRSVYLYDNQTETPWMIVDPTRFCANFLLVEVLAIPQQETEEDNGESDRNTSEPSGTVDQLGNHDPVKGLDENAKGT